MKSGSTKLRVLLLDDEKLVRFTVSAYLRAASFEVTAAETPEEALGYLRQGAFDVIVSDVMMGKVDGFMFRDMVRRLDTDVPIVFLTSMLNDAGNNFMERVMEDVHSFYVSKNAPRTLLVGRLTQVTRAHHAERRLKVLEENHLKNLEIASFVQKSMLPDWFQLTPNYGFSCCWAPHSSISGDLYENFPLSSHESLTILGDISGHGTNAALAMSVVLAFLKQFVGLSPEKAQRQEVLARHVHDFLRSNLKDVAYMAVTFLYRDFRKNRIVYLNAGNPEPLAFRCSGEKIELNPERKGVMPLGMMEDLDVSEKDLVVADVPEDTLIFLYSDGVNDISTDAAGEDTPPRDVLEELFSLAIHEWSGDCCFVGVPYRVLATLENMGYAYRQDDISIFLTGSRPPQNPKPFVCKVPMRPNVIDDIGRAAGEWVKNNFGSLELSVKVDLLLNEHLMNIYRHGFDDFQRQHEIALLTIVRNGSALKVVVWDRGRAEDVIAEGTRDEADRKFDEQNANMADHGRGLAILRKITASIQFERFVNLNKITFNIPIEDSK